MHFSTLLALSLLETTVLGSALLERVPVPVKQTCNADNCYRVMTNTLSVATPFCSTYLQSTTTVTISPTVTVSGMLTTYPPTITPIPSQSIPTHIATQCSLTTAPPLLTRLSSACACLPTPVIPSTVTYTTALPAATTYLHADSQCPSVGNPVYWTGGQRIDGTAMPVGYAEVFNTHCGKYYPGTEILIYGEHWRRGYYFAECIHLCFITPGCVQAAYDDNYFGDSQAGCGLYSDIGEHVSGTIYSGVVVNHCNNAGPDAHCPDTCTSLPASYTSTTNPTLTFDITCGRVFLSDGATFLSGPTLGMTSMSDCIEYCAGTEGCVAADWTDSIDKVHADALNLEPSAYDTPVCAITSALNGNIQVGGFDSAVLHNYPIPDPSVAAPPPRKA